MRAACIAMLAVMACGDDGRDVAPRHVAGTIRYEDRAQQISNTRTILAAAAPLPARRIEVAIFADDTDEPLAMTVADDDGAYALDYAAARDQMVHVTAIAESTDPLHPVQVITKDGSVHAFGGDSFAAGSETADVLVTIDSDEAEAFNVFDNMMTAFDKLNLAFADTTPTPLRVRWYRDNKVRTRFTPSIVTIDLEGSASDDDGFDDDVMLHEFGHYVAFLDSRDDSPGGDHDGRPADPRLAWSEGWATYWEMFVDGAPIYIDTSASGGFFDDDDTTVETASLAAPLDQLVSEGMVTQILWDLGDADAGPGVPDDDGYAGTHATNIAAVKALETATLRTAGSSGVDLVDFLDVWFVMNGLTSCAAIESIVQTTHQFPYDFAGPAGSCP